MTHACEQVLFGRLRVAGFRRGCGVIAAVDAAPLDEADLAAYFAGLDETRLRGCWVACVCDALVRREYLGAGLDVGNLARCLVVVAERLHGVQYKEVVVVESSSRPQKATPLIPATPVGAAAVLVEPEDGAIHTESAPAPWIGPKKNVGILALVERLAGAPAGAWLVVPSALGKPRNVGAAIAGLHRRGLHPTIISYRDALGRSIIKKEK